MTADGQSRGSVTVFFSLLLTLLLAIVCTALESARYSFLDYLTSQAQGAALESVYAGYYRPLWEEYHLLFMADGQGFLETMERELSLAGAAGGFEAGTVRILETETALDRGGAAFLEQVMEDAEAHGKEKLLETVAGQADLVRDGEEVFAYIQDLAGYGEAAARIEEAYEKTAEAGRTLKEQMTGLLESGDRSEEQMEALRRYAQTVLADCREDQAADLTEELREELEAERQRLETRKGQISEAAYEMMEQEVSYLEEYADPAGSRSREAEAVRQTVMDQAEKLLDRESGVPAEDLLREGIQSLSGIPEREAAEQEEEASLLKAAGEWNGQGILRLVLGEEGTVSQKTLKGGPYPSALSEPPEETAAAVKGAAACYMAEHFSRYGKEGEEELLSYEAEYILNGAESDRENLESTARRLTAVRTGLNFLYLMRDGEKRAEAEALAASLVGFTGVYPLVRLAAGLIMGAWALAEALTDVKTLFSGGQVPLRKTAADWKLSLSQAPGAILSPEAGDLSGDGIWDYGGYLMLLFLLGDGEEQYFRMMDVIEFNLRREDAGFYMENCLAFSTVETSFYADALFLRLPVWKTQGGRYVFSQTAAYGY